MPEPQQKGSGSGAPVAAAIAAACLVVTPFVMQSEGLRTTPYKDPVGIPTVCYGETNVVMKIYTKDECATLLRKRLAATYAPKILACLPQLAAPERKHEFAALIDSSYNAGPVAVCKSRMAQHIKAGDWYAACVSIDGWYVTARDRKTGQRVRLKGLVNRRVEMKNLCLRPE